MFLLEPERTQYDVHFPIFGIPVRIHPMFWVVAAVMGFKASEGKPKPLLIWMGVVFVSILIHELGHAVAALAHGWRPWITLYAMGGLASYRPTYRSPKSQIAISLAGPGAGFLFAAFVVAILMATNHPVRFMIGGLQGIDWEIPGIANVPLRQLVNDLLYINIFWGLINLLPVYPLDGGQIARELFNIYNPRDAIRQSLYVSIGTAAAVAIYAVVKLHDNYLAILFGLLGFSSYQMLQAYFGSGGRWGDDW